MSRLSPIIFLQQFSTPFLDSLAIILANFADLLFILVVTLVYWCVDRKKGEALGYISVTNMLSSIFVKNIFKVARPIGQEGIVSLAEESAPGYSFPSTHTQIFSNLTSSLGLFFKKPILIIAMSILTILMGASRVYLGVHYLEDVLGGLLLGVFIAFLGHWLLRRIKGRWRLYGATLFLAAVPLFFSTSTEYVMMFFGFIAFCAGIAFERRYVRFEAKGNRIKKTGRFFLGIFLLLVLYVGLEQLPLPDNIRDTLRYSAVVFTAIGLYPWLFKKINL